MTVTISTNGSELARIAKRLQAVLEIAKKPQLINMQIAQGVIDQTVARIEYEKTDPAGKRWAPWSEAYARTRDAGDSLLIDSRDMIDSFQRKVNRTGFAVWTDIEYAGAHNFGAPSRGIPKRQFMGFSRENLRNIDEWLGQILLNGVGAAKVKQTTRKKSGKKTTPKRKR